jgi:hypothetical protein
MAAVPPGSDALADEVDDAVFLEPVLGPLGLELKLLTSFLGCAIGMKYELVRRSSTTSFVMPSSLNLKWRVGSSNGELRMGLSMTTGGTRRIYSTGGANPKLRELCVLCGLPDFVNVVATAVRAG